MCSTVELPDIICCALRETLCFDFVRVCDVHLKTIPVLPPSVNMSRSFADSSFVSESITLLRLKREFCTENFAKKADLVPKWLGEFLFAPFLH